MVIYYVVGRLEYLVGGHKKKLSKKFGVGTQKFPASKALERGCRQKIPISRKILQPPPDIVNDRSLRIILEETTFFKSSWNACVNFFLKIKYFTQKNSDDIKKIETSIAFLTSKYFRGRKY